MKKQKNIRRAALLLSLLLLLSITVLPVGARETRPTLTVGGIPFGVRFFTDGILVVGYCDVTCEGTCHNPARQAGLAPGDCIYKINGKAMDGTATLAAALQESDGGEMKVDYRRDGVENSVVLHALRCDEDGRWRMGLFVRDSGAGIGTVTFIMEGTGTFAGLGHGICDGESGALIPLARGAVTGVTIVGVTRGMAGAPGELRGRLESGKTGTLLGNTPCGVYGVFSEKMKTNAPRCEIAYSKEVHDGAASVWCTLDDNTSREYSVTLSHIKRGERGNKCFTVTVTDDTLLRCTGGIVQGMSGSPIIQDGRLVGAITHVLIGDPTTGYGIFIENMLANIPAALGEKR